MPPSLAGGQTRQSMLPDPLLALATASSCEMVSSAHDLEPVGRENEVLESGPRNAALDFLLALSDMHVSRARGLPLGHTDCPPGRAFGQAPAQDSAIHSTKPANEPGPCLRTPTMHPCAGAHALYVCAFVLGMPVVPECLSNENIPRALDTWENAGLCGGRRSTAMPSTTSFSVAKSLSPSSVPLCPSSQWVPSSEPPCCLGVMGGRRLCSEASFALL